MMTDIISITLMDSKRPFPNTQTIYSSTIRDTLDIHELCDITIYALDTWQIGGGQTTTPYSSIDYPVDIISRTINTYLTGEHECSCATEESLIDYITLLHTDLHTQTTNNSECEM